MKKLLIIALLLASLILTGCNSSGNNESNSDTDINSDVNGNGTETDDPTHGYVEPTKLSVSETPVYENGLIVIYFTSEDVTYTADSECYVAIISDDAAYSITATPDLAAYPDMLVSDGKYKGVALRPSEEIAAGAFEISITVDNYIINTFDMTIE